MSPNDPVYDETQDDSLSGSEKGPIYGVDLITTLPMQPGRPNGMLQAMPSAADLYAICQNHARVVAGYEVLLAHWHRAETVLRGIAAEIRATRQDGLCLGDEWDDLLDRAESMFPE